MKFLLVISLIALSNILTETVTFTLASTTYSAEIAATTGEIKIKAKTGTDPTAGTVKVEGGLTLTKEGGTAIALTCDAKAITVAGVELTCNPASKIEAAKGNVYTLAVVTPSTSNFVRANAGDAELQFAVGTDKTLTYQAAANGDGDGDGNTTGDGDGNKNNGKYIKMSLLTFILFLFF